MSVDYDRPIGPWPRMQRPQGGVRQIAYDEFTSWIVHEDERLLILNKPGDVVCHPSKDGPWSSLCGAVREYLGGGLAHLVFRLDRETSGIVVMAKDSETSRKLQMAAQERRYEKTYLAIMTGELTGETVVDQPLGRDWTGPVMVKNCVVEGGQRAVTRYVPLLAKRGFTFVRVTTETGRMHQIRAHAQWLGHSLVGDKIYGPDQRLFLEFIEFGWTPKLAERLLFPRQALHCGDVTIQLDGQHLDFRAQLPEDMREFVRDHLGGELPAPFFADGMLPGDAAP